MNYRNRHPWMTGALRTQIKEKNAMHSKALITKNKELFDDYIRKKNLLKSSLRNAEIQYYSDQLELQKK